MIDNQGKCIESAPKKLLFKLSYSPEVQFVLNCARTKITASSKQMAEDLVAQKLDWELVFAYGKLHKVIPLLYKFIADAKIQGIPQETIANFKIYYQNNAAYNLSKLLELRKIISILNEQNIRVFSFKGPSLAISAYGNLALREFGDLDILVEEKNIDRVIDILTELNYPLPKQIAEGEEESFTKSSIFQESKANQKSYDIIDPQRKIFIELHWSLFSKSFQYPVSFLQLWQDRVYTKISNVEAATFSPEDLLLYLCVHGSKHFWSRLRWICDVAELIDCSSQLNWQKLKQKAEKQGCVRMLNLGLILVKELLNISLPEHIVEEIALDKTAQSLAKQVGDRLFDETSASEINGYLFLLRCRELNRDKLQYISSILFVPNEEDWHFFNLPRGLYFLYYIIRPYRLLVRYIFYLTVDEN